MNRLALLSFFAAFFFSSVLQAGQFVGGELSYKVLNNTGSIVEYEISFNMYRNCKSYAELNAPKLTFLNTITAGPVTNVYDLVLTRLSSNFLAYANLPACVMNAPEDCYELIVFKGIISLPVSEKGYSVHYTECCRDNPANYTTESWNTGAETVGGAPEFGPAFTYVATIPPSIAGVNNSPVIVTDSIVGACVGLPLNYKFQFTDSDGDSLVYRFGNAFGKSNSTDLVLRQLNSADGFTSLSPMAGNPEILIDPMTGILSGIPDREGKFLVVLAVHEYRGGILINIHRKEIQINVYNCNPKLSSPPINCNDGLVSFLTHTNSTSLKYLWDFGVAGTTTDTSTRIYPFYTYPSAGSYLVKLILTNRNGCRDSVTTVASVYPGLKVDFNWNEPICNGTPMKLNSNVEVPLGYVTSYEWRYISGRGNVIFSNSADPVFQYAGSNERESTYSLQLSIVTDKGCAGTVIKVPTVYPVPVVNAGPDTTLAFGITYRMPVTENPEYRYLWSPAIGLDNPTIANPLLTGTQDQTYRLQVSSRNGYCVSEDRVTVKFAKGPDIYVPTGFTPNGDLLNDVLGITAVNVKVKSFRVFNRFGQCVFATSNPAESWDGKFKNELQQPGVYTWIVEAVGTAAVPFVKRGSVLLMR